MLAFILPSWELLFDRRELDGGWGVDRGRWPNWGNKLLKLKWGVSYKPRIFIVVITRLQRLPVYGHSSQNINVVAWFQKKKKKLNKESTVSQTADHHLTQVRSGLEPCLHMFAALVPFGWYREGIMEVEYRSSHCARTGARGRNTAVRCTLSSGSWLTLQPWHCCRSNWRKAWRKRGQSCECYDRYLHSWASAPRLCEGACSCWSLSEWCLEGFSVSPFPPREIFAL